MLHASSNFRFNVDLDILLDNTFSTKCSRKLFWMLYGSKKEFKNFVMLYIYSLQSDMKENVF